MKKSILTLTRTALALMAVGVLAGTAVAGSSTISWTSTLQKPDDSGVEGSFGTLTVSKSAKEQELIVKITGLPQSAISQGLGLFIGGANLDTNTFTFINVLNGPGDGGTWSLDLKDTLAPIQLGVGDIEDVTNRFFKVSDTASNTFLMTYIPTLLSKPQKLSYKRHVKYELPSPSPSPKARGVLVVRYDGRKGTTLIQSRFSGLSAGNSYCSTLLPDASYLPVYPCDVEDFHNTISGMLFFSDDTSIGQQLGKGALSQGGITSYDIIGESYYLRDAFGVVHLSVVVPGPGH